MFNGNKIERNIDLNEINLHKKNENYHYINSHNDGNIIKVSQERNSINTKIITNNCNYRKMPQNLYEKDQSNILNVRNSSKKHNIPDYLYNIDLNKLSNNNHDRIDISLLSSESFINNNNNNNNNNCKQNISNNREEISPEKYLDDVLKKDEKDIQNNYNKLLVQTLSSDNNLNQNSILTNSIRSDSEFDFFKKTINRNYKVIKEDNINRIQEKKGDNNEKIENTNDNNRNILNKKISHDDIPIKTYNNFLELVEKELANENNDSKYNNKSFDISSPKNVYSTKKQYPKNKTEGINKYNNEKNIIKDEINEEGDIDKREKENKIIKIIIKKGGKNDKRSKTPDNLIFKRANRKVKNKKITCHDKIPNDNLKNEENMEEKNNMNNNNLAIQQNKINNIINNNSITIISQFDIEEKSIKKPLLNNNLLSNKNGKNDYHQRDDSADKDIANYDDNEFEVNKNEIIQQKVDELNNEINKCIEDRNNFNKMKKQYEKLKSKLISDIQYLTREKEDFEKYRKNEMEKIKTQKQKYISDNKLIRNLKSENELLNRRIQRDKEIIDSLRSQLSQYQNQNKVNKMTNKNNFNNYEFQQLDNNNLSLQQILNKIDLNKYKKKEKQEKLFRNKSALEIKYNNNNKNNNNISNIKPKRMHTSVNEKYETNSKNSQKYIIKQDKSTDKSKSNIKNKINVLTENNSNCQTYESKFYSKRNKAKSIKANIPLHKNSDNLNILSKDKYLDILKLIGNNSKNKNNKTDYSSSSKKQNLNKLNIKNKKYSFKKKLFPKSKSNISLNNNINIKNKPLTSINSINRKSNKLFNNKNKNLSVDRKDNLMIKDKLVLEDYEFKIPDKYQNKNYILLKTFESDEKKIKLYTDNKKEVLFPSGVRKEIYNDGYQIVHFVNGDIKQNFPDGKSVYYFNEAKTVQTTFSNGILVFKFNNDQLERHYPDGKKQILFPDGSERIVLSNGYEETYYSDGRVVKGNTNGQTVTEI